MKIFLLVLIGFVFMTGCSAGEDNYAVEPEKTTVSFVVSNDLNIDKSVVLFFRDVPGADTLVYQTEINGPTDQNNTLTFNMPAGNFYMILLGNTDTSHIRYLNNEHTSKNVIVEYRNGVQPPDIFYGVTLISSGETSKRFAGLLPLNIRVTLTVQQVPSGVEKIVARLKNTSVGIKLNDLTVLNEVAGITDSLDHVTVGSSPVFDFSSFFTVKSFGDSSVEVFCYNTAGELIYSGSSVPFSMGGAEAVSVSCSFATNTISLNSRLEEQNGQYEFYLYPWSD